MFQALVEWMRVRPMLIGEKPVIRAWRLRDGRFEMMPQRDTVMTIQSHR